MGTSNHTLLHNMYASIAGLKAHLTDEVPGSLRHKTREFQVHLLQENINNFIRKLQTDNVSLPWIFWHM